jgi:membrane-associated phospholipid phosphatase
VAPRFNTIDRLYLAWFGLLSVAVGGLHSQVEAWPEFLLVHVACAGAVVGLALAARRSKAAHFLHDWYPLAVFIVCFEEVARLSLTIVPHWQDGYLLAFEARLFPVPPTVWLGSLASRPFTELVDLGYFSYFLLLMVVGGVLYRRRDKQAFREVMLASVASYLVCYVVFLLFPTEGPAHTLAPLHTTVIPGGPIHWAVTFLQRHAGVHGNAFPSSHVGAGVVPLLFAWRYARRLAYWLTPLVVLLCVGAVYERYHYASDVVAGAAVGATVSGLVLWAAKAQPHRARSAQPRLAPDLIPGD